MALYRVPGTWQSHSCHSPHITDKKPEILRGEKGKTEQNPTRKPASSDPLWGGFPSAPSLGQPTEAGKQPGETQTASSFPLLPLPRPPWGISMGKPLGLAVIAKSLIVSIWSTAWETVQAGQKPAWCWRSGSGTSPANQGIQKAPTPTLKGCQAPSHA